MKNGSSGSDPSVIHYRNDPLVHFLALGIILLVCDFFLSPFADERPRIIVSAATQQQLAENWAASAGRPPEGHERDALIASHIQDEILFREAKKIGLDVGDVIIRRRLIQKFEFLSQDAVSTAPVDESVLRRWYATNAARFMVPARRDFDHIFFSEKDGDTARVEATLAAIRADGSNSPEEKQGSKWLDLGDSFPFDRRIVAATREELVADFGGRFANHVFAAPSGEWTGPFPSAYGQHLILVRNAVPEAVPPFDAVQNQVLKAWRDEQQLAAHRQRIDALVSKYDIVIAGDAP